MEIIQLLNLIADQHEMIGTIEDKLDQIISDTLLNTESLEDNELEDVQAATALPFAYKKNIKGDKRGE